MGDEQPKRDFPSSKVTAFPVIEFRRVSKRYNGIQALDDVSFTIRKGDIFGYIGPNGAGKTTTIKVLVGLIHEFRGDVYVKGKHISTSRNEVHKILGYLPQESGFQEWRTVDHAMKTFGYLSGLTPRRLEERIQEVLALVNLSDVRHTKIAHLSGGMVQKLLLAQALLHEPELVVLDEPLTGLDPTSRYQVKNIIRNLAKSGITIFFSSHILSDVQDIATQIGVLNRGQIMRVGTPDELQKHFHMGNVLEIVVAEGSSLGKDLENVVGVDHVTQSTPNRQLVHLTAEADVDACINEIVSKLLEQRCHIRKFNLLQPSLEDVYLKYVGGTIK